MSNIRIKVHIEYANLSPAVNFRVTAREWSTDNSYDLGFTDANGEVEAVLRPKRRISVYDSPFCTWFGCPQHKEDDPFDRPGVTITVTDPNGLAFTTPGYGYGMFDHVHVILPPHFSSAFPNPIPVGRILRRKNLSTDFNLSEQRELANLIYNYLNDEMIEAHMNEVDHLDNLFTDHRSYLYEMEKKLLKDGHSKYVPLPIWEPLNNIPETWDRNKPHRHRSPPPISPLYNQSPLGTRPQIPERLQPARICSENFATAQDLAKEIGRSACSAPGSFHFNAHAALAGPFVQMSTAGAALMFWAFHPVLVEVYDKWLTCKFGDTARIRLGLNIDSDGKGRMELFRIDLDKKLWHTFQRRKCVMRDDLDNLKPEQFDVTFDHWSHWARVGEAKDLIRFKVIGDEQRGLVVLATGADNRLFLMRRGSSGWTHWMDLNVEVFDFAGMIGRNGRLELAVFKKSGLSYTVATATETAEGTSSFGAWEDRTGNLQPGAIQIEKFGRHASPHIFFRTGDGRLHHIWKEFRRPWSGPEVFSNVPVRMFTIVRNLDGRLEVIALRLQDNGIYHRWINPGQSSINWTAASTWSDWERFGSVQFNHLAVGRNTDGRLEVLAIDTSGRVRHIWQTAPNSSWSSWELLPPLVVDQSVTQVIGAVVDHTGRLKVFVQAADHFVYMAEQDRPSQGPWIGWTNL